MRMKGLITLFLCDKFREIFKKNDFSLKKYCKITDIMIIY